MFVNSLVGPSRICVQEKLKYAIKNKTVDIIVNKFQVYYPCRNSVLFINMYMNDFVIRVCSWLHTCTLRLQEISFKMCIITLYVDKIHSINTGTCDVNLVQSLSDLINVRDRNVEDLSGGELQRFACAMVCIQKADM